MTHLNTALNFNFASAEAARIAYAERGAEEAIATQLKQAAAADSFKVGSTITARYQYKVGEDGGLIPLQTQITSDAPFEEKSSRRNGRQLARENGERQPKFTDLLQPKPQLSPTEEIALFAANVAPATPQLNQGDLPPLATHTAPVVNIATAEVVDEDGAPVQAEILTPQVPRNDNNPNAFSARAQYSVATLYARNNDVVYNMTPIAQLAA